MRQAGYYWVKYNNSWEVAEWSICWELIGLDQTKDDSDFDEIDERRIEREASAREKNARYDIAPPKLRSCIVKGCNNPVEVAAFLCNEHLQEYLNDVSPIKEK